MIVMSKLGTKKFKIFQTAIVKKIFRLNILDFFL